MVAKGTGLRGQAQHTAKQEVPRVIKQGGGPWRRGERARKECSGGGKKGKQGQEEAGCSQDFGLTAVFMEASRIIRELSLSSGSTTKDIQEAV